MRKILNYNIFFLILSSTLIAKTITISCNFVDEKKRKINNVSLVLYPYMYYKNSVSNIVTQTGSGKLQVTQPGVYYLYAESEKFKNIWEPLYIDADIDIVVHMRKKGVQIQQATPIEFSNAGCRSAKIYQIFSTFLSLSAENTCSTNNDEFPKQTFVDEKWKKFSTAVREKIKRERDTIVKEAMWIAIIGAWKQGAGIDSLTIVKGMNSIPSNSFLWCYFPIGILEATKFLHQNSYKDEAIQNHPDRWLRAWLMLYQLPFLKTQKDTVTLKKYCSALQSDYKNTDFEKLSKSFYPSE